MNIYQPCTSTNRTRISVQTELTAAHLRKKKTLQCLTSTSHLPHVSESKRFTVNNVQAQQLRLNTCCLQCVFASEESGRKMLPGQI